MHAPTSVRSIASFLLLVGTVACADHATPTAPPSPSAPHLSFSKGKDGNKVAVCKLQKEDWRSAQIGSKGGKVKVGSTELDVPAGALARTVTITAHSLPTTSASVQFAPEGLHFAVPATLKMDYSKCDTPVLGVTVVYVQADTVTEVEPSQNHPVLKYVVAKIGHFSSYAVAY
ncbi:MAG: hypothetical protein ABI446_05155 [Gemmatimonadaceae bacterium]